jgi:hypothetical protein
MYPIADRGSSIRGHGGKVEQTDPCYQNPLVICNIHWYAGAANALRAYGEKVREMMDPGLIEIANEGAEYDFLLPRPWCPWVPLLHKYPHIRLSSTVRLHHEPERELPLDLR